MDKPLEKSIGKAARKARASLGLTQEDAAEQVGVSVEFYSRIERGSALPSLKTFVRMAVAFGMSTDKLLGLCEDEDAQRLIKEFAPPQSDDSPDLRRLLRRLRQGSVHRIRFVNNLLNEVDKILEKETAESTADDASEGGPGPGADDADDADDENGFDPGDDVA
jgi:transcriptional regulator with XRE-family HTH domain